MSTKTKIAIITGGSRGLGRNMSISLAKKEIDIIFTYQSNITEAEKVVQEITSLGRRAKAIQLDIRQNSSFENFLIEVNTYLKQNYTGSKIDFLINNARIGLYAPVTEITEELADDLYHIHFKGVVLLTQKLLPYINNGGAIINISTGLTRIIIPGASIYASMKSGIETYTKYLAKELGERRIRANVVAPGAIETDFGGGRTRDNKEINAYIASNTALGRAGLPEDIG
ncbi:MAG TPA: SDR family NAD(P)-dependent oxidoreductase, partial [Bacteroidia bacterium]